MNGRVPIMLKLLHGIIENGVVMHRTPVQIEISCVLPWKRMFDVFTLLKIKLPTFTIESCVKWLLALKRGQILGRKKDTPIFESLSDLIHFN